MEKCEDAFQQSIKRLLRSFLHLLLRRSLPTSALLLDAPTLDAKSTTRAFPFPHIAVAAWLGSLTDKPVSGAWLSEFHVVLYVAALGLSSKDEDAGPKDGAPKCPSRVGGKRRRGWTPEGERREGQQRPSDQHIILMRERVVEHTN